MTTPPEGVGRIAVGDLRLCSPALPSAPPHRRSAGLPGLIPVVGVERLRSVTGAYREELLPRDRLDPLIPSAVVDHAPDAAPLRAARQGSRRRPGRPLGVHGDVVTSR